MKQIILLLFILVCGTFAVNAQTAPSDNDYDLMQRAQMIAEIKRLRTESEAKDKIIAAQAEQITDLHKLDASQEDRISGLKEANKDRQASNDISTKVENLYETRIAEYKDENARLRTENEKLRKSRDRRSVIALIAGGIAGRLLF